MDHIRRTIATVDEERILQTVYYLAKHPLPFRTVNCTLPGHEKCTLDEADDYLTGLFAGSGYAVARTPYAVQPFACDRTRPLHHWYSGPSPDAPFHAACNLEVTRPGSVLPDEIIQIVAHKDSQSWIDCPGAYDNAVGTSALVEIARVLAGLECRRTVRILLCNEEHAPWTSAFAAQEARERGDNIVAMLNVDSLGGKSDEDIAAGRKTNVTGYTCDEGRRLADLMAAVNDRYRIGLVQTAHLREYPNDDDGSYVKAGYLCAAVNVGSFPYADAEYHLVGDVPERVDFENVRMSTQATLAAIMELDAA